MGGKQTQIKLKDVSYLIVTVDVFLDERSVENPSVVCFDHHEFAQFWRAVPQAVVTLRWKNQRDDGSDGQL